MRPVIALLTDFGLRDHYVAAMKGVILGIAPDATLVDITHEIEPQDVAGAALELASCYRFFPAHTIFLVVVDPGVGTPRRAIAAAAGEWCFVAPDNGVLAPVLDEQPSAPLVVELTSAEFARPDVSRTFEGRDRFAPAAAWLARGVDLHRFGPTLTGIQPLSVPQPRVVGRAAEGHVLRVDRFGNLISNIDRRLLDSIASGGTPLVRIAGHDVARVVKTYGEAPDGAVCALIGSGGFLEVAANGASAARLLGVARGARVVVAADRPALEAIEKTRG